MNLPTDSELLSTWLERQDQQAIELLVERHLSAAFRLAVMVLGNAADAEDAVQIALVQLLRKGHHLRRGRPLRPWLLQVVLNTCRNQQRSSLRRKQHEQLARQEATMHPSHSDPPRLDAETVEQINLALKEIPERLRVPIVLRYIECLSVEETAAVLDRPPKTVESQLRRGLEQAKAIFRRRNLHLDAGMTALLAGLGPRLYGEPPATLAASIHTQLTPITFAAKIPVAVLQSGVAFMSITSSLAIGTLLIMLTAFPGPRFDITAEEGNTDPPPQHTLTEMSLEQQVHSKFIRYDLGEALDYLSRELPLDHPLSWRCFAPLHQRDASLPAKWATIQDPALTLHAWFDRVCEQLGYSWQADEHIVTIIWPLDQAQRDRLLETMQDTQSEAIFRCRAALRLAQAGDRQGLQWIAAAVLHGEPNGKLMQMLLTDNFSLRRRQGTDAGPLREKSPFSTLIGEEDLTNAYDNNPAPTAPEHMLAAKVGIAAAARPLWDAFIHTSKTRAEHTRVVSLSWSTDDIVHTVHIPTTPLDDKIEELWRKIGTLDQHQARMVVTYMVDRGRSDLLPDLHRLATNTAPKKLANPYGDTQNTAIFGNRSILVPPSQQAALSGLVDSRDSSAIPELHAVLATKECPAPIRELLLHTLLELRSQQAVNQLASDANPHHAVHPARIDQMIGSLGEPVLRQLAQGRDQAGRTAATRILAQRHDPTATAALQQLIKQSDAPVGNGNHPSGVNKGGILGRSRLPEAFDTLESWFAGDDTRLHHVAAVNLLHTRDPRAVDLVADYLLNGDDITTKRYLCNSLGDGASYYARNDSIGKALGTIVADPDADPILRRYAALRMKQIACLPAHTANLLRAASDSNDRVLASATRSLAEALVFMPPAEREQTIAVLKANADHPQCRRFVATAQSQAKDILGIDVQLPASTSEPRRGDKSGNDPGQDSDGF